MKRKGNVTLQNSVTMYGKENRENGNKNSGSGNKGGNNSGSGGGGGGGGDWLWCTQRQNYDPALYDWSRTYFYN